MNLKSESFCFSFFLLTKAKTPYYLLPAHPKDKGCRQERWACSGRTQKRSPLSSLGNLQGSQGSFSPPTLIRLWAVETVQLSASAIPWIPLAEQHISSFQLWVQGDLRSSRCSGPHAPPFRATFLLTFIPVFPRVLKFILKNLNNEYFLGHVDKHSMSWDTEELMKNEDYSIFFKKIWNLNRLFYQRANLKLCHWKWSQPSFPIFRGSWFCPISKYKK